MHLNLPPLNFPSFNFQLKQINGRTYIFDIVRKKYILLQEEEWVRQHMIHFLIQEKKIPTHMLSVEKKITLNGHTKRYDILAYNRNGSVFCIVECKAPQVRISQEVFDQIARYNMVLQAQFLVISNGFSHYSCKINAVAQQYDFLPDIPSYRQTNNTNI